MAVEVETDQDCPFLLLMDDPAPFDRTCRTSGIGYHNGEWKGVARITAASLAPE